MNEFRNATVKVESQNVSLLVLRVGESECVGRSEAGGSCEASGNGRNGEGGGDDNNE